MSCAISKTKKVGLALGNPAAYATPTASTAQFLRGLVVTSFVSDPIQTVEPVPEIRGTLGAMRVTKGPIGYTPTIGFPLDIAHTDVVWSACVGDFLAGVYGLETPTKVGSLYKHRFSVLESTAVPYFNLVTDKDAVGKQITGFVPGSIKFTINAKEAMIPVEVTGIAKDEIDGYGTTSLTYSSAGVVSGSMISAINLAGSAISSLETIEITITREQEALNFLTSNTRTISEVCSGKSFTCSITATGLLFATETERNKFKNVGTSSFDVTLTDGTSYLTFYCPQINYQTFAGPNLAATDILKVNFTAIVTGTIANHYVELANGSSYRYDTGVAIT